MSSSIPYEARSTELALGSSCVVDAAETVASVGVTELGRILRVCISTAVTWDTSSRGFVEPGTALVTVWAAVPVKALVTHCRAIIVATCAGGGGVGAGARCTGFGQGSSVAVVETRLTLLTV